MNSLIKEMVFLFVVSLIISTVANYYGHKEIALIFLLVMIPSVSVIVYFLLGLMEAVIKMPDNLKLRGINKPGLGLITDSSGHKKIAILGNLDNHR